MSSETAHINGSREMLLFQARERPQPHTLRPRSPAVLIGPRRIGGVARRASLKELMARLGHSSTRAALIYQHASRDRDRAIAEALGDLARHVRLATSDGAEEPRENA